MRPTHAMYWTGGTWRSSPDRGRIKGWTLPIRRACYFASQRRRMRASPASRCGTTARTLTTTRDDRERFFGQSVASRIHVIEAGWLVRMQDCRLYAYELPAEAFRPHVTDGYWVCDEPVDALDQVVIDDLLGRHARARIELRITPSIWPFWDRVTASSVEYSGCRLRSTRS